MVNGLPSKQKLWVQIPLPIFKNSRIFELCIFNINMLLNSLLFCRVLGNILIKKGKKNVVEQILGDLLSEKKFLYKYMHKIYRKSNLPLNIKIFPRRKQVWYKWRLISKKKSFKKGALFLKKNMHFKKGKNIKNNLKVFLRVLHNPKLDFIFAHKKKYSKGIWFFRKCLRKVRYRLYKNTKIESNIKKKKVRFKNVWKWTYTRYKMLYLHNVLNKHSKYLNTRKNWGLNAKTFKPIFFEKKRLCSTSNKNALRIQENLNLQNYRFSLFNSILETTLPKNSFSYKEHFYCIDSFLNVRNNLNLDRMFFKKTWLQNYKKRFEKK